MRVPTAPSQRTVRTFGFTLVELAVVICIIALMALITFPAVGYYKKRAYDVRCMGNLRTLHGALSGYMSEHAQVWPQYPNKQDTADDSMAKWWYDTLKPYGASRSTWLCPEHIVDPASGPEQENYDFSYIPTQFDDEPNVAFKYPQPWVIEFGGVHEGNMANQVMPDGSLRKQENPAPPKKK